MIVQTVRLISIEDFRRSFVSALWALVVSLHGEIVFTPVMSHALANFLVPHLALALLLVLLNSEWILLVSLV